MNDASHNSAPQRRLKIAFIHQPWSVIEPPVNNADSIALWTDEVARRLVVDCDITCYSRHWGNQPTVQKVNGIEYRHMSVSRDRWIKGGFDKLDEWGFRSTTRPFYASDLCYRQFINGVLKDLKRLQPDVVHIQNFSQFVPMVREVLPDTKIVLHMHAEWLAQIDRNWINHRIGEADSVIFCSNYFAQQTRDAWPQYAGRCRVVYNGATLSEFEGSVVERTGPKRLLFVGRISPDKGVHNLVEAFKQVLAKHPGTELKIVGPFATLPKSFCLSMAAEPIVQDLAKFYDRPYVDQLRERFTPETEKQIEITGPISRKELVAQFRQCSILVLPSIYPEGFGIPIVEAAACRAPSVCARRGGMPEVVEQNKTGIIVEANDIEGLANALNRLLDDESLRQQMGNAAHDRVVDNFTWDKIAHALLTEYHRVVGNNKPEQPLNITRGLAASAAG